MHSLVKSLLPQDIIRTRNLAGLRKKMQTLLVQGIRITEAENKCLPQAHYSIIIYWRVSHMLLGEIFTMRHGQRKNSFLSSEQ